MPKPLPLMHVFRAGQQTTAAGAAIAFSEDDLVNCAKAYDPSVHEAPICVGHPKGDMPAYGWIKSVSASGGDLMAERHQVDPEFAEMARAGRFKKVSAAFYPPDSPNNPVPGVWYLRHVAFLGAQPPSVKGLRAVEFADNEAGVLHAAEIEFSDPAITNLSELFGSLRDWFIDKFSLEDADRVLPKWQIESVSRMGSERPYVAADVVDPPFARVAFDEGKSSTQQETDVSTEKIAQLEADVAAANLRATTAETLLAAGAAAASTAAAASRAASATEFAESLVTADQLLPKDKALVAAVLCAVETEAPVEFGEGEAKKPLGTALRDLLGGLPKHALNGKHIVTTIRVTPGAPSEAQGIADAAIEFQEAEAKLGRHVSTHAAVQHVVTTQGAQK